MEYENDIDIIPKRRKVVLKSQKFESYGWILITIRALRKTFCRIEFFLTIFISTTKTPESAKKNYQNNSILDQISISKKNPNLFVTFPDSCDIQKLQLLIQRDLRKFLQHKF
jgi:hypothetical protein